MGPLHDDGLNGDAFAGDKVFTIVVTLNPASVGVIELEVSADFTGVAPVLSPVLSVYFQPANAPQQSIAALAQYLQAGNINSALNYVVQSAKTVQALNALHQQGLNALASMLNAATLVSSQNDMRIFQAPLVTAGGTTTVEFSMVPGPTGQWALNTW